MINGTLMSRFSIAPALSFSTLGISFAFRNPAQNIDCSIVPVFVVSLFDFKYNNILAQTYSNNLECPSFNGNLYAINVTGNLQLQTNSVNVFTISLEKSAAFLKITPVSSNSAITFQPTSIVFQNYSSTVQQFKITVLQPVLGSYDISFLKVESGSPFYNDISAERVTVIASTTNHSVTFGAVSAKSVKLPISIPVYLEQETPF